MQLQQIVNESVSVNPNIVSEPDGVYVDLANLDLDKLRAAFAKTPRKNTVVFDLQQAVEKKLEQMMKENPLRFKFYDRYKEIIDEYNKGKNLEDTVKAFNDLGAYIQELNVEDSRAMRENLTEETLAIYDLLREGKELSKDEMKQVKKVAVETLEKLKEEKLKIVRWRRFTNCLQCKIPDRNTRRRQQHRSKNRIIHTHKSRHHKTNRAGRKRRRAYAGNATDAEQLRKHISIINKRPR